MYNFSQSYNVYLIKFSCVCFTFLTFCRSKLETFLTKLSKLARQTFRVDPSAMNHSEFFLLETRDFLLPKVVRMWHKKQPQKRAVFPWKKHPKTWLIHSRKPKKVGFRDMSHEQKLCFGQLGGEGIFLGFLGLTLRLEDGLCNFFSLKPSGKTHGPWNIYHD